MRPTTPIGLAATVLVAACGDGATGPQRITSIAELQGTWMIVVWEYSLAADTSRKVDWVVSEGLTGTLSIGPSGDFTLEINVPALGTFQDLGTLSLRGDTIYYDGEGDEELVPFELRGNTLTLFWPETELVDMDGDGQPEDVWLRRVFERT